VQTPYRICFVGSSGPAAAAVALVMSLDRGGSQREETLPLPLRC